jgi:hypothetical protein
MGNPKVKYWEQVKQEIEKLWTKRFGE